MMTVTDTIEICQEFVLFVTYTVQHSAAFMYVHRFYSSILNE